MIPNNLKRLLYSEKKLPISILRYKSSMKKDILQTRYNSSLFKSCCCRLSCPKSHTRHYKSKHIPTDTKIS